MILVFSGTGNSLHVANLLAEHLHDSVVRLPLDGNSLSLAHTDRVIWVFPVYSWGVPPVVIRWIKQIQFESSEGLVHHAVLTCGDDVGHADKMWRNLMKEKSQTAGCVFSVIMPNTYVLMRGFDVDSPRLEAEKVKASSARVADIARIISDGPQTAVTDVVRGKFPWIKTRVIYPWFCRFDMSPRPFHSTDACTACGLCASQCPMNNISMTSGRPRWAENCALCLGCYHVCPHHAVAYGKITARKGQKKVLRK